MDSERILELLAKQLGRNASEEEIAELNELLLQNPRFHYFSQILHSIEGEKRHYEPASKEGDVVREGWSRLENALPSENAHSSLREIPTGRKSGIMIWLLKAAIWIGVILLAGGAYYMWKPSAGKTETRIAINAKQETVPYGAPQRKVLPDSSIVWLNAGSHIRYADNVKENRREAYLDGEAYFDIKQDPSHPFIVHAGNIIIKVLGTAFNIKAYEDENRIETTLISGKIQVQIAGNPDKRIVLAPKEKLTVINQKFNIKGSDSENQKELSFQVKEVVPLQTSTPIPEIAWLQDKLAFQNERFDELARGLSRRYNVHIVFLDTLLKNEKLNGVFENEDIQKAMKLLQMTTPFNYIIKKDTVYLSGQ